MADRVYCCCCARQVVSYSISDEYVVGGRPHILMFGNQVCCHECSNLLDKNGLFPEEREE